MYFGALLKPLGIAALREAAVVKFQTEDQPGPLEAAANPVSGTASGRPLKKRDLDSAAKNGGAISVAQAG